MMNIYQYILENRKNGLTAALLDPDSEQISDLEERIKNIEKGGVDFLFIGGSTCWKVDFKTFAKRVKEITDLPLVIFPGSAEQISNSADALLLLSLVSGKNPRYLIEEHVEAAPFLKDMEIEIIPTGYILVEGGNITTVEYITGTTPIPRDKPEIAKYIAYASELLGMKLIYMDCGSGAKKSITVDFIKKVRDFINIPIIVGGGIKSQKEIKEKHSAGADIIVIGSALEKNPDFFNF